MRYATENSRRRCAANASVVTITFYPLRPSRYAATTGARYISGNGKCENERARSTVMTAPVKYSTRPMLAATPTAGTNRPTTRPAAPAALATPSQVHQDVGTPYAARGSTTHFARVNTETAEKPTQSAAAMVTTVKAVD